MNQQEEEIRLLDYLRVLAKHKLLLIFGTLLPALCGYLIATFCTPVYSVETMLEVGIISDHPIEPPASIKTKVDMKLYENIVSKSLFIRDEERPEILAQTFPNTNLVLIKATSSNPKLAEKLLAGITALILNDHEKIVAQSNASFVSEMKDLEAQFAVLENKKSSSLETNYFRLVERAVGPRIVSQTRVIQEPVPSPKPISVSKEYDAFLAGMLGLVLSVLYIFFISKIEAHDKDGPLPHSDSE